MLTSTAFLDEPTLPEQGISFKQGDTVNIPVSRLLPVGTWAISSEIRDNVGTLIATWSVTPATITVTDATIASAWVQGLTNAQTAAMPIGRYQSDIKFITGGQPTRSPSFFVDVAAGVTA